MLKKLFGFLLVAAILSGCESDDVKMEDVLMLHKHFFEFPASGGTFSVEVASNIEYVVTIPEAFQSWIIAIPKSRAVTSAGFRFSVSENADKEIRKGYVVFDGLSLVDTVYVQQAAGTETVIIGESTDITDKFDPDFARVLQEKEYIPNAAKITLGDVNKKTEIHIDDSQLTSLRGIEYFTALEKLECRSNQLVKLDISRNLALTEVYCEKNQLSALDVSQNTKLMKLYCWENRISILDVSKNLALTELDCDINQLSTLDVSKNTELTLLYCSRNLFSTINVSENLKLTHFSCTDGKLVALDLDKNTKLTEVKCHNNPGNGTVFPLTAWFDENNLPKELKTEWTYDNKRIVLQITTK